MHPGECTLLKNSSLYITVLHLNINKNSSCLNQTFPLTHQFISVLGPGQVADLRAGVCAL